MQPDELVDEMLSYLRGDFADHEPASQVASFYSGRSVFITGATGFIGKVTRQGREDWSRVGVTRLLILLFLIPVAC